MGIFREEIDDVVGFGGPNLGECVSQEKAKTIEFEEERKGKKDLDEVHEKLVSISSKMKETSKYWCCTTVLQYFIE